MTPLECAEKILLLCQLPASDSAYSDHKNGLPINLKKDIAAQIEEACAEALNLGFTNGLKCEYRHRVGDPYCPECYEQGFSAAKEKAKGIAEKAECTCGVWTKVIASRIDQMTPKKRVLTKVRGVVHKSMELNRLSPYQFTVCPLIYPLSGNRVTFRWSKVTCKRCLSKKGKE